MHDTSHRKGATWARVLHMDGTGGKLRIYVPFRLHLEAALPAVAVDATEQKREGPKLPHRRRHGLGER